MKKIVIRIMKSAGYDFLGEKDGRLLFWHAEMEIDVQIIIGMKMIEKAVSIIIARSRDVGRYEGRYEIQKIIKEYKNLMS